MSDKDKHVYLMVPRKLIITWIVTYVLLLILVGASIQWTNYMAQKWCGIVTLFNTEYKKTPPITPLGQNIAREMDRLAKSYDCS